MGLTHHYKMQILNDAGQSVARGDVAVQAEGEIEFSVTVTDPTPNAVALPVVAANIQAFYIVSDQEVDMVENTSDLTVTLLPGQPYFWYTGQGDNPFTVNVVTLNFTRTGTPAAHVHGSFLVSA